jgi:hypothetical protein
MSLVVTAEAERLLRVSDEALSMAHGNLGRAVDTRQVESITAGAIRETLRATQLVQVLLRELKNANNTQRRR